MSKPLPPLPKPVVAADQSLFEITVKALILGALLSALLAAANAYIGLLVGLTVSASIPAAAVSMGVLRLFPRSNILENNMVQTSASAGESLVAGTIFTIPALVIMGAWQNYQYGPMVCIAIVGGVLGVAFTIPLRRALIVEARLKFPEGVATAEVLKSGGIESASKESSASSALGFKTLMQATGLGAIVKLFESGFGVLAGGVAGIQSTLGGSVLLSGNFTLSPALLGVGYIVGLNIAILVFIGGVIGTLLGVPINWLINPEGIMTGAGIDPATPIASLTDNDWVALANESWQKNRRIGVGAMMIGGLWSLISLSKPLINGVQASLRAHREAKTDGGSQLRTELDTPIQYVMLTAVIAIVPLFLIFNWALADYEHKILVSALMTVLMLVFGFIFSSVAGYMAGLVGSSNNPISGVTIATVIISALILLQIMGNDGIAATLGPIAVIFLAGLICSAAAIAGDNMQDLKCGHLIGATPWRQQLFQVIGVVAAAFVIPVVLNVLDQGYGIGRPSVINPDATPLSAPQAGLMRDLSTGIFGAGIEWNYIYAGFVLAIILIILDEIQKRRESDFRFPVLAVAVGIYLPLGLSVPIFLGGLIVYLMERRSKHLDTDRRQARENTGLLLASGLITGEALMGVVIAIVAAFIVPLPPTMAFGGILGFLVFGGVIYYLYHKVMRA